MAELLTKLLSKWPIKVLTIMFLLIIASLIGILSINLETGNQTLIDSETDVYQDNLMYQESFGADPIVIVFEENTTEELLSIETFKMIDELSETVGRMDGVFYVASPMVVVEQIGSMQQENYETGLREIANNLYDISEMILSFSDQATDNSALENAFSNLIIAQELIGNNAGQLSTNYETFIQMLEGEITSIETSIASMDPLIESMMIQEKTKSKMLLTQVLELIKNSNEFSKNVGTGATQTSLALTSINSQILEMFTSQQDQLKNLTELAAGLSTMADNIALLSDNFNVFAAGIPTEQDTLDMMMYPNDELNPMMEQFLIDDSHLFMSIILNEGLSHSEIEEILDEIDRVLSDTKYEDILVSGKPVLDFGIKESMMESMQLMMATSGIIMVVILGVLFNVKLRFLPLITVLIVVVATIGIMGWVTIPMTMVSMAVFPVLIGLGIDYSIQFHSRYIEEIDNEENILMMGGDEIE